MSKQSILASVLALLLISSGVILAQAKFTTVTDIQETIVNIPVPGEVTCHGAAPTGNPFMPCPPGIGGTVRGRTSIALEVSPNDPRLTGTNTVSANANIRPDGTTIIWGTFSMAVSAGTWEGVWEGKQSADGVSYRAQGHGSGGSIDGLQLLWDATYAAGAPGGTATARILEPARK
jgi:hypothetical protein